MSDEKSIKSFMKNNKIDLIFILFIILFTSILVYFLINANNQLGIYCSDVFIYLTNALNFSGNSVGKVSNLYLSPVICFLTSLIFRFGFIDQIAIFIVTGIFLPIASIGSYLLFRLRLNKLISLFGAILFSSFSLNILWTANGSLDIPAIAISIWIIYFTILATDKNPKYFLLAFPLFVIGFFTRYTVGFILPLMFLYILFDIDIIQKIKSIFTRKRLTLSLKKLIKSDKFKYCMAGIIIALILYSSFTIVLTSKGSDLTFISQTQSAVSGDKGSSIDPGFKPDPYFYITNMPNFISSENIKFDEFIPILQEPTILSYLVIILILGGGLAYILNILIEYKNFKNLKTVLRSKKGLILNIIIIAIISTIIITTYKHISSVRSEILFLINILLIFNVLNQMKIHFNKLNKLKKSDNLNKSNKLNGINKLKKSDNLNKSNKLNGINKLKKSDNLNKSNKLNGVNELNELNKSNNFSLQINITHKKYNSGINGLNFNLLMISWFFIYLIFFSFSDVKVDRYFITVLPVIAYFTAYSLNYLLNHVNFDNIFKKNDDNENIYKTKKKSLIPTVITIGLILIFIGSAFVNIGTIPSENKDVSGPAEISEWLINYDSNYDNQVIWTHNVRYYTWYLKMNVYPAYEKDIPKLGTNNVTYFISKNISKENQTIENYTVIKKYDNIFIYQKDSYIPSKYSNFNSKQK